jgi:ketosteroid isomerase-like protein
MSSLEARIARLEAESQIRQLIAGYCFYIDDREIDKVRTLFTDDAVLDSADGVMGAKGVDAIIEQYHGRFNVLGAGHHFMHDILINFVGDGTEEARGRVIGHAELWRNNQMMVTALRYDDVYRNTSEGWRFARRTINFLYYVPIKDYPDILGTRNRNMAYPEPRAADFPENLPSWIAYEQSRGRG